MNLETIKQLKPVYKHLLIASGAALTIILMFFYVYLPITTNHGEAISVPNVVNQHIDELADVLESRNLRFVVNADSSYSPDQEPLTVIDQFPLANSKVKEQRKIYVTLNARKPPLMKMPNLRDKSLMIAQITLQSYGLKVGRTNYKDDLALNAVLEQYVSGRVIKPGDLIPKGSRVDLDLGNGLGKVTWSMYDYVNQRFSDARVGIIGIGLYLGKIEYVKDPNATIKTVDALGDTITTTLVVPKGNIVRQYPPAGQTVRLQDVVDLWIYQPDSVFRKTSILEDN